MLAVASQLVGGLDLAAVTLLNPAFAAFVLVVIVALAAWRMAAVSEAFVSEGGLRMGRPSRMALAVLLAGILLMHGVAGYVAWAFYDAGSRIFNGPDNTAVQPTPNPSSTPGSAPTTEPTEAIPTPAVTPRTASDRVNILLTGLDSGHDRNHSLSDTLLVVSIDPSERTVAMVSFPRDISNFPLYDGGTYNDKINSLWTAARNNPGRFPDGPINTLGKEIGFLLGIPIHYTAAINLEGFERMVNLVGGVDVVNPKRIADSTYDWFDGTYGFYMPAGKQHLDGRTALAFVRSRKGAGDNDFTRAARQQLLLVAVRNRMTDPKILAKLPAILDAAARTIQTNFPPERLREFLELSKEVDDQTIQRVVLGPPYAFHPPTNSTGGIYTLRLHMDQLAQVSVQLFGTDSAYYDALMKRPMPTLRPGPGI